MCAQLFNELYGVSMKDWINVWMVLWQEHAHDDQHPARKRPFALFDPNRVRSQDPMVPFMMPGRDGDNWTALSMLHSKPGDVLVWNSTVVAHATSVDPEKFPKDIEIENVPQDTAQLTFDMRCVCVPRLRDLGVDEPPKLSDNGRSFCRKRWEHAADEGNPLKREVISGFGNPDNDKSDWCVLRRQHGPGKQVGPLYKRFSRRRQ